MAYPRDKTMSTCHRLACAPRDASVAALFGADLGSVRTQRVVIGTAGSLATH